MQTRSTDSVAQLRQVEQCRADPVRLCLSLNSLCETIAMASEKYLRYFETGMAVSLFINIVFRYVNTPACGDVIVLCFRAISLVLEHTPGACEANSSRHKTIASMVGVCVHKAICGEWTFVQSDVNTLYEECLRTMRFVYQDDATGKVNTLSFTKDLITLCSSRCDYVARQAFDTLAILSANITLPPDSDVPASHKGFFSMIKRFVKMGFASKTETTTTKKELCQEIHEQQDNAEGGEDVRDHAGVCGAEKDDMSRGPPSPSSSASSTSSYSRSHGRARNTLVQSVEAVCAPFLLDIIEKQHMLLESTPEAWVLLQRALQCLVLLVQRALLCQRRSTACVLMPVTLFDTVLRMIHTLDISHDSSRASASNSTNGRISTRGSGGGGGGGGGDGSLVAAGMCTERVLCCTTLLALGAQCRSAAVRQCLLSSHGQHFVNRVLDAAHSVVTTLSFDPFAHENRHSGVRAEFMSALPNRTANRTAMRNTDTISILAALHVVLLACREVSPMLRRAWWLQESRNCCMLNDRNSHHHTHNRRHRTTHKHHLCATCSFSASAASTPWSGKSKPAGVLKMILPLHRWYVEDDQRHSTELKPALCAALEMAWQRHQKRCTLKSADCSGVVDLQAMKISGSMWIARKTLHRHWIPFDFRLVADDDEEKQQQQQQQQQTQQRECEATRPSSLSSGSATSCWECTASPGMRVGAHEWPRVSLLEMCAQCRDAGQMVKDTEAGGCDPIRRTNSSLSVSLPFMSLSMMMHASQPGMCPTEEQEPPVGWRHRGGDAITRRSDGLDSRAGSLEQHARNQDAEEEMSSEVRSPIRVSDTCNRTGGNHDSHCISANDVHSKLACRSDARAHTGAAAMTHAPQRSGLHGSAMPASCESEILFAEEYVHKLCLCVTHASGRLVRACAMRACVSVLYGVLRHNAPAAQSRLLHRVMMPLCEALRESTAIEADLESHWLSLVVMDWVLSVNASVRERFCQLTARCGLLHQLDRMCADMGVSGSCFYHDGSSYSRGLEGSMSSTVHHNTGGCNNSSTNVNNNTNISSLSFATPLHLRVLRGMSCMDSSVREQDNIRRSTLAHGPAGVNGSSCIYSSMHNRCSGTNSATAMPCNNNSNITSNSVNNTDNGINNDISHTNVNHGSANSSSECHESRCVALGSDSSFTLTSSATTMTCSGIHYMTGEGSPARPSSPRVWGVLCTTRRLCAEIHQTLCALPRLLPDRSRGDMGSLLLVQKPPPLQRQPPHPLVHTISLSTTDSEHTTSPSNTATYTTLNSNTTAVSSPPSCAHPMTPAPAGVTPMPTHPPDLVSAPLLTFTSTGSPRVTATAVTLTQPSTMDTTRQEKAFARSHETMHTRRADEAHPAGPWGGGGGGGYLSSALGSTRRIESNGSRRDGAGLGAGYAIAETARLQAVTETLFRLARAPGLHESALRELFEALLAAEDVTPFEVYQMNLAGALVSYLLPNQSMGSLFGAPCTFDPQSAAVAAGGVSVGCARVALPDSMEYPEETGAAAAAPSTTWAAAGRTAQAMHEAASTTSRCPQPVPTTPGRLDWTSPMTYGTPITGMLRRHTSEPRLRALLTFSESYPRAMRRLVRDVVSTLTLHANLPLVESTMTYRAVECRPVREAFEAMIAISPAVGLCRGRGAAAASISREAGAGRQTDETPATWQPSAIRSTTRAADAGAAVDRELRGQDETWAPPPARVCRNDHTRMLPMPSIEGHHRKDGGDDDAATPLRLHERYPSAVSGGYGCAVCSYYPCESCANRDSDAEFGVLRDESHHQQQQQQQSHDHTQTSSSCNDNDNDTRNNNNNEAGTVRDERGSLHAPQRVVSDSHGPRSMSHCSANHTWTNRTSHYNRTIHNSAAVGDDAHGDRARTTNETDGHCANHTMRETDPHSDSETSGRSTGALGGLFGCLAVPTLYCYRRRPVRHRRCLSPAVDAATLLLDGAPPFHARSSSHGGGGAVSESTAGAAAARGRNVHLLVSMGDVERWLRTGVSSTKSTQHAPTTPSSLSTILPFYLRTVYFLLGFRSEFASDALCAVPVTRNGWVAQKLLRHPPMLERLVREQLLSYAGSSARMSLSTRRLVSESAALAVVTRVGAIVDLDDDYRPAADSASRANSHKDNNHVNNEHEVHTDTDNSATITTSSNNNNNLGNTHNDCSNRINGAGKSKKNGRSVGKKHIGDYARRIGALEKVQQQQRQQQQRQHTRPGPTTSTPASPTATRTTTASATAAASKKATALPLPSLTGAEMGRAKELIRRALEERYTLYRPVVGVCAMQETLFSVLYREAFAQGNVAMVWQLENCLMQLHGSAESIAPYTNTTHPRPATVFVTHCVGTGNDRDTHDEDDSNRPSPCRASGAAGQREAKQDGQDIIECREVGVEEAGRAERGNKRTIRHTHHAIHDTTTNNASANDHSCSSSASHTPSHIPINTPPSRVAHGANSADENDRHTTRSSSMNLLNSVSAREDESHPLGMFTSRHAARRPECPEPPYLPAVHPYMYSRHTGHAHHRCHDSRHRYRPHDAAGDDEENEDSSHHERSPALRGVDPVGGGCGYSAFFRNLRVLLCRGDSVSTRSCMSSNSAASSLLRRKNRYDRLARRGSGGGPSQTDDAFTTSLSRASVVMFHHFLADDVPRCVCGTHTRADFDLVPDHCTKLTACATTVMSRRHDCTKAELDNSLRGTNGVGGGGGGGCVIRRDGRGTKTAHCPCDTSDRSTRPTSRPEQTTATSRVGMTLTLPEMAHREDMILLILLHDALSQSGALDDTAEVEGSDAEHGSLGGSGVAGHAGSRTRGLVDSGRCRRVDFLNLSLAAKVMQSAESSALRVSVLPPQFALPRWVNFVLVHANFLIPFSARYTLARYLAVEARRAFTQHIRASQLHRRLPCRGDVMHAAEWSRRSNHKFTVRRNGLAQDAYTVLRKCADARLPVSMEFSGDAGVGQGPTAQFYTLVAKEMCRAGLQLWRQPSTAPHRATAAGVDDGTSATRTSRERHDNDTHNHTDDDDDDQNDHSHTCLCTTVGNAADGGAGAECHVGRMQPARDRDRQDRNEACRGKEEETTVTQTKDTNTRRSGAMRQASAARGNAALARCASTGCRPRGPLGDRSTTKHGGFGGWGWTQSYTRLVSGQAMTPPGTGITQTTPATAGTGGKVVCEKDGHGAAMMCLPSPPEKRIEPCRKNSRTIDNHHHHNNNGNGNKGSNGNGESSSRSADDTGDNSGSSMSDRVHAHPTEYTSNPVHTAGSITAVDSSRMNRDCAMAHANSRKSADDNQVPVSMEEDTPGGLSWWARTEGLAQAGAEGLYPRVIKEVVRLTESGAIEVNLPTSSSSHVSSAAAHTSAVRRAWLMQKWRERWRAYYTLGAALGRAFLDGQVLPLPLCPVMTTFLRRACPSGLCTHTNKSPPRKRDGSCCGTDEDCRASVSAVDSDAMLDVLGLNLTHLREIDAELYRGLISLARLAADSSASYTPRPSHPGSDSAESVLASMAISFTLPGVDGYELVARGGERFIQDKADVSTYLRAVMRVMLYDAVALPRHALAMGWADVVPREALHVLRPRELLGVLCGEGGGVGLGGEYDGGNTRSGRTSAPPLWTHAEIQYVLVGDHGYHKDSPELTMLANVLAYRFTPAEQRLFLMFCTGCPGLPMGGVRALGSITVVRRSDALTDGSSYPRAVAAQTTHDSEYEEEEEESHEMAESATHASPSAAECSADDVPPLSAVGMREDATDTVYAASVRERRERLVRTGRDNDSTGNTEYHIFDDSTNANADEGRSDYVPVLSSRSGVAHLSQCPANQRSDGTPPISETTIAARAAATVVTDKDDRRRVWSTAENPSDALRWPDTEWALPTVNTCFRYLKLPPYPTEELMYKKLLQSVTLSGDTFELS